jgi:hypothetical protein
MKHFKLIFLLSIISNTACKQSNTNSQEQNGSNKNTELPQSDKTQKIADDKIGEPIDNIGNSILYTTYEGFEENEQYNTYAVPIVVFYNNKYLDPPTCEFGNNSPSAIYECERAQKILLPSVRSGSTLFVLDNGAKSYAITVIGTKKFGFSDWTRYSAHIKEKPNGSILTDNPKIGTNKLYPIKDKPTLERRKDGEGGYFQDKLLTKVDVDGDGMPELIYECGDYEGTFYIIYSNKNGKWKKIYEGGYQGV